MQVLMSEIILKPLHEWNLPIPQAIELQRQLAKQVILQDHVGEVKYVAGVDMAINKEHETARAAVVLLTSEKLPLF